MYTRAMPRLEEILATLAALPGARAAVLAGFDGLLVDEAVAPVTATTTAPYVPAVVDTAEALISDTQVPFGDHEGRADPTDGDAAVAPDGATVALDGAVVELTHAWNGVRRACAEYLAGGAARELIVMADDGAVVAQVVGDAWFVFLWTAPDADLAASRAALRDAAAQLAEVVR